MEYTNYWEIKENRGTKTKFKAFIKDMKILLEESRDIVTVSAIDNTVVCFNGSKGNQHEDCYISNISKGSNFCKTIRLPYDKVVIATLLLLKYHYGNLVSLGSDGLNSDGSYEEILQKGIDYFKNIFPSRCDWEKYLKYYNLSFDNSFKNVS